MDKRVEKEPAEISEIELLVRQSDEDTALFDPARIADVLVRETRLAPDLAKQISFEVKDQIERCSIQSLTSSLIRELVDAKLLEYGLIGAHRAHSRLGVPIFDVDRVIQSALLSGTPAHGPEGTSLVLAEAIKRDYAMIAVFSDTVASAHYSGDIQIEHLGEIDRPTRLMSSIDLIKRNGITLPGGFAGSKPARRAEVLAAHLVTYTAALHGYFSAPVVWDSVNYAFAPFIAELDERDLKQLTQGLIFELSAPAIARGGQPVHCDLHIDIEPPNYLRERTAIGPGGEKLPATYADYAEPALKFSRALLGVLLEGDGEGMPFAEPRLIVHITRRTIEEPALRQILELACELSARRGGVTLAFDRAAETAVTFSARYGVADEKLLKEDETWQWRTAFFSSTAINLPRIGYRAEGDRVKVFELISELLELAAQASLEKRVFLEKLLARGESGSLALLAKRPDNDALLPLNRTMHAICPIGVAELAEGVFGKALDSSSESQEFAAHIVAHLEKDLLRLSSKHKVKFILAESSDLTAAHRLARLDLKAFGAETVVQIPAGSSGEHGECAYYSRGLRLPVASSVPSPDRQRIEGLISGSRIFGSSGEHWMGTTDVNVAMMTDLVEKIFNHTGLPALTFAPEFTVCLSCRVVSRGINSACPECGSDRVDEIALESERMTRTSQWPRFKRAEMEHRKREN
jgi:ribonucleoside-triphosphate reductase (formate)